MLDKYRDSQEQVVTILSNQLDSKRISHAYLFVSNNYSKTIELIEDFIISIILLQKPVDVEVLSSKIKHRTFSDLTVIEPDGMFIKKEQINILQREFQNTALENEKKFYIIKEADKLNKSSANTILKFLEEPEDNIIAFLVTNNKNSVLETISSRCVNINLWSDIVQSASTKTNIASILYNNITEQQKYMESEDSQPEIDAVIKLLSYYEANGIETLLHINDLFHLRFKEKEDIARAIEIMIIFYGDVLKKSIIESTSIFIDNIELIDKIITKNDNLKISKKIEILIETKAKVRENANIKLLMDKLIIDLEEV